MEKCGALKKSEETAQERASTEEKIINRSEGRTTSNDQLKSQEEEKKHLLKTYGVTMFSHISKCLEKLS